MARRKIGEDLLTDIIEHGISLKHRTVSIVGSIDDKLVQTISIAFDEFADNDSPVRLKLYSEGGEVRAALAIIGMMVAAPFQVHVEAYGQVESAATLILAAGNHRAISKYAWFMHHESSYQFEGRHSEFKAFVKQQQREEVQWANLMAGFTKKDAKFWISEGVSIDAHFTSDTLLEMGVVDEIL